MSKRRSVGPVPAMSTTARSSLPDSSWATTSRTPRSGSSPGTMPDTSFPTSSSAEEQPLGCPRGERGADGLGAGLDRLGLELQRRQPALALSGHETGGLARQAPLPDVREGLGGLRAAEQHRLLGSGVGEGEGKGRGQRALACASLAAEQVQNESVTHVGNVCCPCSESRSPAAARHTRGGRRSGQHGSDPQESSVRGQKVKDSRTRQHTPAGPGSQRSWALAGWASGGWEGPAASAAAAAARTSAL